MGYLGYKTGIQPNTKGADDLFSDLQGTRDGAPFSADWILAKCMEGRVFCANSGTGTAPSTWGAGGLSTTEFDFHLSVPSGTTVIPLELSAVFEVWGSNSIFEIVALTGTGSITGAGTAITPTNLRTDAPYTSLCTITAEPTTTSTTAATTNIVEFWREGIIKVVTPATAGASGGTIGTKFSWSHKTAGYSPVIVGAGQMVVYLSAQAGEGFFTLIYVEIPSSRVT